MDRRQLPPERTGLPSTRVSAVSSFCLQGCERGKRKCLSSIALTPGACLETGAGGLLTPVKEFSLYVGPKLLHDLRGRIGSDLLQQFFHIVPNGSVIGIVSV